MYYLCTLRKGTYFVLTHVSRVFYAVPVVLCAFLCTFVVHCAKGAQCINARQPSFLCRAGCLFLRHPCPEGARISTVAVRQSQLIMMQYYTKCLLMEILPLGYRLGEE